MKQKRRSFNQRQIPRSALLWLMISYIVAIAPHFLFYLPLWILPIIVGLTLWRIAIYRARVSFPKGWMKGGLLLVFLAILYLAEGSFFNNYAFSILFILLFTFKFVEARRIRDAQVLGFLSYFSIAIGYIYNSSLLLALYSLLPLVTTTMGLIALQQIDHHPFRGRFLLKESGRLILLSFPFMVIFFLFFPRFPSPLTLGQPADQMIHQTGVSDSMNPGEIAHLVESDEHLFWADFKQELPPEEELYWRVLTLDHFDGEGWSRSEALFNQRQGPYYEIDRNFAGEYSVIMEGNGRHYIATLDITELKEGYRFNQYPDFRYEYRTTINQKIQYHGNYFPKALLEPRYTLSPYDRRRYLAYPVGENPETERWVETHLMALPIEKRVAAIAEYIYNNDFYYTLTPEPLRGAFVDRFLFESRRGFCEHYASTAAVMLRMAQVPTRVVVGYYGGEINHNERRIQVRSAHAHAWVEFWIRDAGWIRFDPTAAIHPSRIEEEISALQQGSVRYEGPLHRRLIAHFRAVKEQIDYHWSRTILGYDAERYRSFVDALLGGRGVELLLLIGGGGVLLLLILTLLLLYKPWRRREQSLKQLFLELMQGLEMLYGHSFLKAATLRELLEQGEAVAERRGSAFPMELRHYILRVESRLYTDHHPLTASEIRALRREFRDIIKLFMQSRGKK